jgi:copper(I)-binding protein
MKTLKFQSFMTMIFMSFNLYAGEISIQNPIIRLVPEVSTVSASFMTIKNSSKKDVRLTKVECGISKTVELHSMIMDGDKMVMRPTDNMVIKAMGELELKRGSFHVMFIDLLKPLKEGEKKPMKFIFDNGEQINLDVPVTRID